MVNYMEHDITATRIDIFDGLGISLPILNYRKLKVFLTIEIQ